MPTIVSVQPMPLLARCDVQVQEEETQVSLELQPGSGECIRLQVTVSGGERGVPVSLKISGNILEPVHVDWTAVRRAPSASEESHGAAQEESETESDITEANRLSFHPSCSIQSTPQHNRFERAHRPSTVPRSHKWDDGLPPDPEESPSVRRQILYEQKRAQGYKPEED